MKLLFDQNLSFKLCRRLTDVFPDSNQVRLLDMSDTDDRTIWDFAKTHDFVIVSQDADFADLSTLYGPPPKVIWLRCGNQKTSFIEQRLRAHADELRVFELDDAAAVCEVY